MNLWDTIRQTLGAIFAHKMRSFLTMFGIIWGISSVILLVGFGRGFSAQQKANMKSLGTDLVIIWGGRTSDQAGGYAAGRTIQLIADDAIAIQKECSKIRYVSPEVRRGVNEVSRFNQAARPVRGVWPIYQSFRSINVGVGRLMTDDDENESRRVVLLGFDAAHQLYPGKPAVGEQLLMNGIPYTVIGVLAKKRQNSSYGSGQDDGQLFMPFSSMERDFPPNFKGSFPGWVNNLVVQVDDPSEHEEAMRQVYATLGKRHHFNADDKDALLVWDTMRGAKLVQRIFDVMTAFFGSVALTTLSLGGIGVMNIMLVTVTERTREIGIRKALGASQMDILKQFFAEAAVITWLSGGVGLLVGVGLCWLLGMVPKPDFIPTPIISTWSVAISVVTLGIITMTAGMYPAKRASVMTPIACLHQD